MHRTLSAAVLAVSLLTGQSAARAHIVLTEANAPAGAYHLVTIRVPHGCAGSPTLALRVTLPEEVITAKPMAKPGWRIEITREPLAKPVPREGGMATERTQAIIWSGGSLPDAYVDEFSILLRLPERTGRLWFPTVQSCETGEVAWTDTSSPGGGGKHARNPAPGLTLLAPATGRAKG